MADISNKTLAILVGIALVVSVIGVFGPGLTGRGTTDTGTAYIYPLGSLAVSVTDNTIDFLNGSIGSGSVCTIDSADGSHTGVCGPTWLSTKDIFEIKNTGTVVANITIKASKTAAEWITGTSPVQQYKGLDGNCTTGQTTYTNLLTTETKLCDDLAPNQMLNISMKVTIPDDATAGQRNNTITFTAHQI